MTGKYTTGDLFDYSPNVPEPRRMPKQPPGGIVAEHSRMNNQRQFMDRAKRHGPPNGRMSTNLRFDAFHKANPLVYTRLVELARRIKAQGHLRYGMQD